MNWFFSKPKTSAVVMPSAQKWLDFDQKNLAVFLRSEVGRKLFEACRHKLFVDHVDACQNAGGAEQNNAAIRGANNMLSHILWLSTEDSISGTVPAKADNTADDMRESSDEIKTRF